VNLLVITDKSFQLEVDRILSSYTTKYYILERENSETSETASMHKLDIYEFPELSQFINILYVDLDCVFQGDIYKILSNTLKDTILYVMPENIDLSYHNHIYWSLGNYNNTDIDFFTNNNIYTFNAGCFLFKYTDGMKEHFLKLKELIKNHTGDFFYEQSFMNVYFNKLNIVDYTIITKDLYRLEFFSPTDLLPELIVHFCGNPGNGASKIERINDYYKIEDITVQSPSPLTPPKLLVTNNKILVIMCDNRPLSSNYDSNEFWGYTAYINKTYCNMHNYDFQYYIPHYKNNKHLNSCIDVNTNELRHSAWSKLLAVIYSSTKEYEYIVYIDTDCIFKNSSILLESIIETHNNDLIFQSNYPWHPELPCSGFFICKNTIESLKLLKEWYTYKVPDYYSIEWQNTLNLAKKSCSYDWAPGKHWEQDILWVFVANKNIKISVTTEEVGLEEKDNQYLRHICSVYSGDRNNYFKNIVDIRLSNNYPSYKSIIDSIYQEEIDTSEIIKLFSLI
jgi:hypothetical protein